MLVKKACDHCDQINVFEVGDPPLPNSLTADQREHIGIVFYALIKADVIKGRGLKRVKNLYDFMATLTGLSPSTLKVIYDTFAEQNNETFQVKK